MCKYVYILVIKYFNITILVFLQLKSNLNNNSQLNDLINIYHFVIN